MASVACFINGHEQTQLNRVSFFISLVYSLIPKNLTIKNLFIMFPMLFSGLYVTCKHMMLCNDVRISSE